MLVLDLSLARASPESEWKARGNRKYDLPRVHACLGRDRTMSDAVGNSQVFFALPIAAPFLYGKTFLHSLRSLRALAYGGLPTITKDFLTIFWLQPYLLSSTTTIVFIILLHLPNDAARAFDNRVEEAKEALEQHKSWTRKRGDPARFDRDCKPTSTPPDTSFDACS